ncbi:MAG: DUF4105 domain-containing protein [Bacteroidia bacterium]|nr:DUF4105 domain-containing protein [Bacteroidia bacterium]
MKKLVLLAILSMILFPKVYATQLSPEAQISLLTCAPGDEIYSYFGHSAIRINDRQAGIDYVFNYGVFSFESPNFIWRFVKGQTDYMLYGYLMASFMEEYQKDQRSVYEQVLNISQSEKQLLFDALIENAKKENRVYRYRHFSDNCATRVRDQFEKCVNHQLQYDTLKDSKLSYRDLVDQYVPGNSWNGFGIKLALGIPADKTTTYSQKMFLPDYLLRSMAGAKVVNDGAGVLFVLPQTTLFEAKPLRSGFSLTSPAVVVNLFFLVVALFSFIEYRRKKRMIWLDFLVFLSIGFAGILLSFLCFISVSEATGWNLNLVWALPTHIVFAFLWLIPSLRPKLTWYLKFTAGIVLLFLITMTFLPQTFHWLVVPLCLIILLRSASSLMPAASRRLMT